nr:RNA-directed DNA polymerase, eukaryota [Tanacetum cinerariifolium]
MVFIDLFSIKALWGNLNFDHVVGPLIGFSGGVVCVWDSSMFIKDHVSKSDYFVVIMGTWTPTSTKLLIISVYAPQESTKKQDLWNYLRSLINRRERETMIMGDYNEVQGFDSFIETTWKSMNLIDRNGLIRMKKKLQLFKSAIKIWMKEARTISNAKKVNIQHNLTKVDKIIDQVGESSPNPTTSNPKCRNRRRSKQPFILEESPVDTMVDQSTMAELVRAPTEGYAEAIVVPLFLAEHFELKHSLINMMTSDQFFRLEKDNPHDHIRWFNKITSTIKYKDVPNSTYSRCVDDYRKKSKVRNSQNKSIVSQVKSSDGNSSSSSELAKLTHAVNHQTSVVTTAMTAILKQFQATPPLTFVKAVEEICVTCGGAHPYYQCLAADGNNFLEFRDNIQGYVSAAAVNYNQGNSSYHPPSVAIQIRPLGFAQPNMQNNQNRFSQGYIRGNNFNKDTSYQALIQQNQVVPLSELEKIKKMNEINIKDMQNQINNVKNELRNEMKTSIQASMSNQTNELKSMVASFFQMNIASTSSLGPLPSNIIANLKGELKAITTRSGLFLDGPSIPIPHPFINPEEDERVEETLTDPKLAEYTIKVPPHLVQKAKPHSQRNYVKLPEKLGDPGKFLIPCGFSELKCKALANLGAGINLMLLSVWKKLGLPELISTRMTLELANRAICTSVGIARDVFVPTFLRTALALIDVHGEEIILRDGDERLTLNVRHDTSSYSNQPQKESINMINICKDSYEDYLEDLFATNHLMANTTSSPDHLLEEFVDELALIIFPPRNDDLPFDIESDLREIEYLLNRDPTKEMDSVLQDSVDECNLVDPNNDIVDTIPEMFTDEHILDYSSPPLYDDVDDDLVELVSKTDDLYDDPFDSKEDKIKVSKLLINELDPPRSSDLLPSPEYDSVLNEDFSKVDALPSINNENKDCSNFEDSCSSFCPSITRSSHPQLHFGNSIS